MNETELLAEIDRVNGILQTEETLYKNRIAPHQGELFRLTAEYSGSCSPLKPGDEIEYTPSGHPHAGIVRIEQARCMEVPDRWEYKVRILSVGESRDKSPVGREIWLTINRWEKPKVLSVAPK